MNEVMIIITAKPIFLSIPCSTQAFIKLASTSGGFNFIKLIRILTCAVEKYNIFYSKWIFNTGWQLKNKESLFMECLKTTKIYRIFLPI